MRRFLRLLVWISSIYLVLCAAVAAFLADVTVHPYHRSLPANAAIEFRRAAAALKSKVEDVQLEAQDHVSLRAWLVQPQHGNGQAVILLHGLGDNRLGTVGYAQLLLVHGYAVLMPDARAHGESGGNLATYGLLERDDIRRWFEWVSRTNHPHCIYGLGVLRPVIEMALIIARFRYHLDLKHASPADVVANTRVPVLLIHGQSDGNIPLRHSRLIHTRNSRVTLWEVPGADHCGAISVAPAQFEERVVSWFELHKHQGAEPHIQAAAAN